MEITPRPDGAQVKKRIMAVEEHHQPAALARSGEIGVSHEAPFRLENVRIRSLHVGCVHHLGGGPYDTPVPFLQGLKVGLKHVGGINSTEKTLPALSFQRFQQSATHGVAHTEFAHRSDHG
jgi:hypothetical protein